MSTPSESFTPTPGLRARVMRPEDVKDALAIIARHRMDDAEVAAETYREGLETQFVLVRADDDGKEQVVGVTGAEPIESSDNSWWLCETYLDPQRPPDSATAADALGLVREAVRRLDGRKLFAMVGDADPPLDVGGGTWERRDPLGPYLEFGFDRELYHPDYYAPREGMHILGLRLRPPSPRNIPPDERPIVVMDCDEIEETDDAYGIKWAFTDEAASSDGGGIERVIEEVRRWDGRFVLAGVPSDAHAALRQFTKAGFREEGRLRDMMEDGIDEVRLRRDL